jgi:hypothetical protein
MLGMLIGIAMRGSGRGGSGGHYCHADSPAGWPFGHCTQCGAAADARQAETKAFWAARGAANRAAKARRYARNTAKVEAKRAAKRAPAVEPAKVASSGPRDWAPAEETRAQRRARVTAFAESRGA